MGSQDSGPAATIARVAGTILHTMVTTVRSRMFGSPGRGCASGAGGVLPPALEAQRVAIQAMPESELKRVARDMRKLQPRELEQLLAQAAADAAAAGGGGAVDEQTAAVLAALELIKRLSNGARFLASAERGRARQEEQPGDEQQLPRAAPAPRAQQEPAPQFSQVGSWPAARPCPLCPGHPLWLGADNAVPCVARRPSAACSCHTTSPRTRRPHHARNTHPCPP